MARENRKNVRLNNTELEKFEDFIEESGEFKSVSQMFRQVAHQYVNGYESGSGASIDPDEMRNVVDESLSPLAKRLADIDDQMATMAARVADDEETSDLASQVYHALPVHESGEDMYSPVESFHIADAEDYIDKAQLASTPTAWANYFGVSPPKMRRALGMMLDGYPDAQYYEDTRSDGLPAPERRYYKLSE